MMFTK